MNVARADGAPSKPWPFFYKYCVSKNVVTVFRNNAASETSFFVSEMEQM